MEIIIIGRLIVKNSIFLLANFFWPNLYPKTNASTINAITNNVCQI